MNDNCGMISRFVSREIRRLLDQSETGPGKARLAELRRGVGKAPGEIPALWGALLQNMPEAFYAGSGEPTRAEWAAYTALTLFALHQQGSDAGSAPMCRITEKDEDGRLHDYRLGTAISRLCHNMDGQYTDDDRARIERRFVPMATAADMPELAQHLRGLVQLLKADKQPLDYPALAVDLYLYQNADQRSNVRLRWGEDFYRNRTNEDGEVKKDEQ